MKRPVTILEVPYHFGLKNVAVGAGPGRLLEMGADRVLAYRGVPAQVQHIDLRDKSCEGEDAIVDWGRQLRIAVREARQQELLPVVLAGNCISCLGTLAGMDGFEPGIVWFDAHPDFHTPDTSVSGNLEGMALAAAVGHCLADLRGRIGLTAPVEDRNVALVGTRDVEAGERERVHDFQLKVLAAEAPLRVELSASEVYLHLDLDFLALEDSPGVNYRNAGGVPLELAVEMVRSVCETLPVAAVGLTNYRPDMDDEGKSGRAALRLLGALV